MKYCPNKIGITHKINRNTNSISPPKNKDINKIEIIVKSIKPTIKNNFQFFFCSLKGRHTDDFLNTTQLFP